MDFVDGLPASKGKTTIYVVVDRLSKYAHFIPISHPYTAISVAHVFFDNVFKLHGMPQSVVSDRDPTFTSLFWKELFQLQEIEFKFSSAYHPQSNGQTEVVNRTLEMYLRCFTSSRPKEWVKWVPWVEYCYNTSTHSSTRKTPFEIVYGRAPPTLLSYVPGTSQVESVDVELQARDSVIKELKENIQQAQERMRRYYNGKHTEREFQVGEWVFLRLQPYRQASLSLRRNIKLSPRFYGPYKIVRRIGTVAYELELLPGTKIHPVFHVSLLKCQVGQQIQVQTALPNVREEDGMVVPLPQTVLERRIKKRKAELLIHWQGLTPAEATWEVEEDMKNRYPDLALEVKSCLRGGELLCA